MRGGVQEGQISVKAKALPVKVFEELGVLIRNKESVDSLEKDSRGCWRRKDRQR